MGTIFRVIALFIGLVFVLGGGACTLVGLPTIFMILFSNQSGTVLMYIVATAIGVVILVMGIFLLRFAKGTKPDPNQTNDAGNS